MRRHGRITVVAVAVLAVLALTGCAGGGAGGDADDGAGHAAAPACPPAPELAGPPQRVVTMDGGAAAVLERLGVGDRIVGTAAPDFLDAFTGPRRTALDRIPVLDPGQGNAEAVIAAEPDLVVGISAYSFGGFDGTPTVQRLRDAGAASLVACDDAPAPVTGIDDTYAFVERAARVFGVPERGAELVAEIRSAVEAAAPAPGTAPVRVLMLSSAPQPGQPLSTLGGGGLANGIVTLAGGTNIAQDTGADFAALSAEEVAARDPQAIVVITGFAPQGDAELLGAVRSSPVLAATTAVRENRIVAVPQSITLSPSVLNGQAVATVARGIHPAP
ncbi:ABC transporter substrate-binding protein [Pseudonocardia sp. HH130630-07]|uniref:ABC transporter substrate-binding protein n=1 Tax=Pseudonocardia sp. HH130630-07 TaxID=1690815 RepID=UPI000814CE6B|nr:ABC transporter substrate-binding protein [Pseudonocardia sp. HH130630-07]ANY06955.1 ABC transporter substrate-binding protein [Pseudonocardia sp. HH130630-07]